MKGFLKTAVVVAMIAFMSNFAMAQTFTYPLKGKQGFNLTEKTRDGLHISYNLGQMSLNQLNYRGEEMSEINISAIVLPNVAGCPNIPAESRLLAIPQGATARLNVLHVEKEIIRNVNIAPALRIQAENEEPDMNYVKDMNVYSKNAYYPLEPFDIGTSYIRGVDAVTVTVSPFQYNPVTKDLIVYTNVELSVTFEGGNGHFGDDRLRSPYWDPILAAELMNYDQLPVIDYAARMQQWLRDGADGAEYLIITPNNDAWAEYANQLRDYRTRQGILTKVYRLDEMPATSTNEMKTWFHSAYNTWEIAPVAVCLMGDHGSNLSQYIPAEVVAHPYEGSCITDNRYADPSGDNLPDMVFSRLVAQNATELPVFVGKQIEYEYTNPNMDSSFYNSSITALGWQTERWFQLCSEVFGGYMRNKGYTTNRINCIYSGTPGSEWSTAQNTEMPVSYFGPNGLNYIPQSPTELGNWNNGSPEQVVQAVNQGAFWLQHRDHGYVLGWGEPSVSNDHVAQMNNVGKMPFVMSINCQTGKFNYDSNCFAEAWMRRTYNGENAGAVGILCPTEISYSFVNDAFVWGVYDLFDGDFLPDYGPYTPAGVKTGNWMPAFGNVAGKYFLQQTTWPYNTDDKDITYTMFTAHCDAFLRIYTQVPQTMEVVHPEVVIAGVGEMDITAPQGCMISLVKQNNDGGWDIIAVAESTGNSQTIQFEPQVPPTEINLVITGQNYLRYEAVMLVLPAEGSYLAVVGQSPTSTPINQETPLSLTIKNVGMDATTAPTSVMLSSSDDRLSILDGTAQLGIMDSDESITLTDEFSFLIDEYVADKTKFQIDVTMTCGTETWVGKVFITANNAVLSYQGMVWDGGFVPGETITVSAKFKNTGHYQATNAIVTMSSTSDYVSISNPTVNVDTIAINEEVIVPFTITIASDCPETEQMPIIFTMTADGGLTATGTETLKNSCMLYFALSDSYGDGWNGSTLTVSFDDGTASQTLGMTSGSTASYELEVGNGTHVTLTWASGSQWDSECSFTVSYEGDLLIYQSSGTPSAGVLYEFDCNCAAASQVFMVNVSSSDPELGTASGGGEYTYGQTCTVTATPADGYYFMNWTKNGTVVSTSAEYSFVVNSDVDLVANFTSGFTVTVSSDNPDHGTVSGGGEYGYGVTCTVTATPAEGYFFTGWTQDGTLVSGAGSTYSFTVTSDIELVAHFLEGFMIGDGGTATNSYLPSYSYYNYSLTQQIYTIEELGTPGMITSIAFYNGGSTKTRSYDLYMRNTAKSAFSGGSDWETVTEADKVFSGSVTMTANAWTSIVLDIPFIYDGSSNVVVVADDNTGSYSSGMQCRVFNATGKALYIYSDGTNYNPYTPTSYSGTVLGVKNQIILTKESLGDCVRVTNLTATEVGPDFVRLSWTENGASEEWVVVCNGTTFEAVSNEGFLLEGLEPETEYTIQVRPVCDENLFGAPITVTTLEACPTPQAVEVNNITHAAATVAWTGYNDNYNVCLGIPTIITLVDADFADGIPANWINSETYPWSIVDGHIQSGNGGVHSSTSSISVTVTFPTDGTVEFDAECRGEGSSTYWDHCDFYIDGTRKLYVGANVSGWNHYGYEVSAGEHTFVWSYTKDGSVHPTGDYFAVDNVVAVSSEFDWNTPISAEDATYTFTGLTPETTYCVRVQGVCGETETEWSGIVYFVTSEEPESVTQTTNLTQGWTWWGTYIELEGEDGLSMLEGSLGASGLTIKSQDAFVEYDAQAGTWMGGLASIDNASGYKVKVSESCTSEMSGTVAVASDHPVTLVQGWNWIGYPVPTPQTVTTALSGFEPSEGDIIKGQNSYASYSEETGWMPSDYTLTPGECYMYNSGTAEAKTLVYAEGRGEASYAPAGCQWNADRHAYPDNLSVTATVEVGGEEQRGEELELGAFVGGECRGSVRLYQVEPLNRYIAFLTVTGRDGDQVEFRLLDGINGETVTSADPITFQSDAVIGSLSSPYPIRFGAMNGLVETQTKVCLYPNPVDRNTTYTLLVPEGETVAETMVFNAVGDIVQLETGNPTRFMMHGIPTSGVYMVKVTCKSGNVYIGRVVVK